MHKGTLEEALRAGLPRDVVESPLFSADLAPVPAERRTWGTYEFAALWISMAHCIPTYMYAGTLIASGMSWKQALFTILVGNLIVLVPILLNAHPGTRYGIPFPVFARAAFGTKGANVPAMLRALVACGWFGIQTFIGGEAVKTFVVALWPGFGELGGESTVLGLSLSSAITFFVFWSLNLWIVYRGMNAVRVFENWAAPLVLVMAGALLAWAWKAAGGFGPMLDQPSRFPDVATFWPAFVPAVTAMVGFWSTLSLNVPDFTRYGRGQKEQAWGQTLGLPTTMLVFSAMGVFITSASHAILAGADPAKLWDPVFLLAQLTSATPPPGMSEPMIASAVVRALVALLALVGVGIATVSVNIAANVVSPANDFANLAPRWISFRTGGLITGLVGVAMMPWKLLASAGGYVFTWLVGYSALLGPIAGILIVDYWILRRRELDVADLYRPHGRYRGVRWSAMLALALGVAPNVPGFLHAATWVERVPAWCDAVYPYAWFLGFAVAAVLYGVLGRVSSAVSDSAIERG